MKKSYPMIYGWFALSGSTSERGQQYPEPIYASESAAVFAQGSLKELHLARDEYGIRLLAGRLYLPVRVNPAEPASQILINRIFANKPDSLEGSFILLEIKSGANPEIRIVADKFGFRRLLWTERNDKLYFSTHLSGLRRMLGDVFEISGDALLHYYNFGFTSSRETLLSGIRKLRMGHELTVAEGRLSIEPYFKVEELYRPHDYMNMTEEDLCRLIDERLGLSIQLRSPVNGQLAVALSGGVDSGYLLQKAVEEGLPVRAYNLCYSGFYDEFERVDFLCGKLGAPLEKISLEPAQIIENFELVNELTSEPAGYNNATMRLIAEPAMAGGASVLFDGDGCDRIFLGMNQFVRLRKFYDLFRCFRRLGLLGPAKAGLALSSREVARKALLHFRNWSKGIDFYPERNLGRPGIYDEAYERRVHAISVAEYQQECRRALGEVEFGLWLTCQSLNMCPEMFFFDPMDIQLELGLYPAPAYWDQELISLGMSLPTDMKLKGAVTKYILRKAAGLNIDKDYWMLPKIGLQNSYEFVSRSPEGMQWRDDRIELVKQSPEYQTLAEIVPERPNPERLIPLVVWKERQGLA